MQEHLLQGVGVYDGLKSSQPAHTVPLQEVYNSILGQPSQLPPLKDVTAVQAKMLEVGSKDFPEYKIYKETAYNCAFSFVAGHTRNAKEVKQYDNSEIHSRLVNFDCDNEALELVQRLQALEKICKGLFEWVDFAARSQSAPLMGSFWFNALVEIPASFEALPYGIAKHLNRKTWVKDLHKLFYQAVKHLLKEALGYDVIGGASHDVTRVRTMVGDTSAYQNTNTTALSLSTLFELLDSGKISGLKSNRATTSSTTGQQITKDFNVTNAQENKALNYAVNELVNRPNPCLWVDGNHHNFQFELSVILNRLGVPQDSATRLILANYPRRSYGGLGNAVESAYKATEYFGVQNYLLHQHDFILSEGQTISDYSTPINEIVRSGKCIIKAPTGTGKSYAVTKSLSESFVNDGIICVYVAPTNILATQTAGANIPLVTGESLKDVERFQTIETEILSKCKVVTNQNTFPKLVKHLKSLGLEIACFIDECDTLISGCSYKGLNLMATIESAIDVCDYAVLYSATPYLFDHYTKPSFTLINIEQTSRPAINLVVTPFSGKLESNVLQFVEKHSKNDNILLIRINDKDLINGLYNALMSVFQAEQVVKVYSSNDIKETEDFQRLAHGLATNNSFFDGVRIVLCTGLIDCGLSIYECERDIVSAYFEAKDLDITSLTQFADRFRTKNEKTLHYFYPPCTLESDISTLETLISDLEKKDTSLILSELDKLKDKLQIKQAILSKKKQVFDEKGFYRAKLREAKRTAKAWSLTGFEYYDIQETSQHDFIKYDFEFKRFKVCRFAVGNFVRRSIMKYNTIEKVINALPSYFKVSHSTIEANELNTKLAEAGQMLETEKQMQAESTIINALFSINGSDIQDNPQAKQFVTYIHHKTRSKKLQKVASETFLHLDRINAIGAQYTSLDKHLDLAKLICERWTIVSPYPINRKMVKDVILLGSERFTTLSQRLHNYFNITCKEKHSPIDKVKAIYLNLIFEYLSKNLTFTLKELSDYIRVNTKGKELFYKGKDLMQLVRTIFVIKATGGKVEKVYQVINTIELENIEDILKG